MQATMTKEEERACSLVGMNKNDFLRARQREIDSLTEVEKDSCRALGVNPVDYLKTKKRDKDEQVALNALSYDEIKACQGTGIDFVEFYKDKMAGRHL